MRFWWSRFHPSLPADGSDPDIRAWVQKWAQVKVKRIHWDFNCGFEKKTFPFSCWKIPNRQLKIQVILMWLKPGRWRRAKGECLSHSGNSINIHWMNEYMNNVENRILRKTRNSWKPSHLPLNSHNFSEFFLWCFIVISKSAWSLLLGSNAFLTILTCVIYKILYYLALPLQLQLHSSSILKLAAPWTCHTHLSLFFPYSSPSSRILHLLRTNQIPVTCKVRSISGGWYQLKSVF